MPKRKENSLRFILLILFIITFLPSCSQQLKTNQKSVVINVTENIHNLIQEEDTDGDKKITIDDRFIEDKKGDKKFVLYDTKGDKYNIEGTYHLSNLLQELTLLKQVKKVKCILDLNRIYENPVDRISRSIRDIYWDGLTRSIDEKNIVHVFKDTKTKTFDGFNYIYVPFADNTAYQYFKKIADRHSGLRIKVVQLPKKLTPEWVKSRNGYHGLLSLALRKDNKGQLSGVPFVVPGGRFNEMYGWDSYFEALGLLQDNRLDLAKSMVDNFIYQINYYGKILNANRSYYLTRSQPPFLTSMALAVYEKMPENPQNRKWLNTVLQAAIKEYNNVWMNEDRLTYTGLSRYYGSGLGQPPEVEPGHFDAIYSKFAKEMNLSADELKKLYKKGEIDLPELDLFFTHDRTMRESGHDKTYRWNDRCADFVTVDLNCLLYKIENDIAKIILSEFNDRLVFKDGSIHTSSNWYNKARIRKQLINKYLWDDKQGIFYDYDIVKKQCKQYMSATVFYPLWANIADKKQAESIVNNALPVLEMPGGIVASTEKSRGEISANRPARQWDYPNGWARHQMLVWKGLINYGYDDVAYRLIYRWLYTITRNAADYNGTIPEKFDVVNRTHRVFAEYGNVGTDFSYITKEGFGWMNASYQVGLSYLPKKMCNELKRLTPPEKLFE